MSGNGADLGHIAAMLQQVLSNQGAHSQQLGNLGSRMTGVEGRLDSLERDMRDVKGQITGLRQTVVEYHSAVLGHGMLISELDERLRRVEQHLGLSPAA